MAQAQTGCDAIERIPVGHTFASAAKQIASRGVRSPQRGHPTHQQLIDRVGR
jgi:hypothetical protein